MLTHNKHKFYLSILLLAFLTTSSQANLLDSLKDRFQDKHPPSSMAAQMAPNVGINREQASVTPVTRPGKVPDKIAIDSPSTVKPLLSNRFSILSSKAEHGPRSVNSLEQNAGRAAGDSKGINTLGSRSAAYGLGAGKSNTTTPPKEITEDAYSLSRSPADTFSGNSSIKDENIYQAGEMDFSSGRRSATVTEDAYSFGRDTAGTAE
ncbi:hypothetical protein [Candidatus Odyssella thessalonicensis]|uniref:hypothetical protein n=1 Tax=Candidatus Odyssella thessalonicensis TaxID=84647 RepID=UPI000225BF75|nr:hypothetical protein [Candidatus Odyssella thessalonicensis]